MALLARLTYQLRARISGEITLRGIIGLVVLTVAALMFRNQLAEFVHWTLNHIIGAAENASKGQSK